MTTESLLVLTPITMPDDYLLSHQFVAIFLTTSALIVFPISYLINNLSKRYSERKILFILLLLCVLSSGMLINFYTYVVGLYRFMIFYMILFVCCNILESVDSVLMAKVFPSQLNIGIVNSGFMIILTTSGGRFIGSLLITVFSQIMDEEHVYDCLMILYFSSFAILSLVVYNYYDKLRLTAILRIIQKHQ